MRFSALLLLVLLAACASRPPPTPVAVVVPPPGADTRQMFCVPYARERSGLDLHGDGWEWWDAAAGRYARGQQPEPGAVLVFNRTNRLMDGHVAVVTTLVSAREILVDHANWDARQGGGPISLKQLVRDVSPQNDWTAVQVWYPPINQLGLTHFPTRGFVLPRPPAATALRQS